MDTKYVSGVAALKRRIATIRETLQLPPMMDAIGDLMVKRTLTRFDAEVDASGRDWAPLSVSTLRKRARAGTGKKKLNETGAMRAAIKLIRGSAAGAVYTNTGAGFRIGISDPAQTLKGAVHNKGTDTVPQRRFLGVGSLDVKAVASLMHRRAKKLNLIERTL